MYLRCVGQSCWSECRGWGCLFLFRDCGCGGCYGGRQKKVNAEQVSWRVVSSVWQAKEAGPSSRNVNMLELASSCKQSGAEQKVRDCGRARLGARSGLLAEDQVRDCVCRGECLIIGNIGNAAKMGIAAITIDSGKREVSKIQARDNGVCWTTKQCLVRTAMHVICPRI